MIASCNSSITPKGNHRLQLLTEAVIPVRQSFLLDARSYSDRRLFARLQSSGSVGRGSELPYILQVGSRGWSGWAERPRAFIQGDQTAIDSSSRVAARCESLAGMRALVCLRSLACDRSLEIPACKQASASSQLSKSCPGTHPFWQYRW